MIWRMIADGVMLIVTHDPRVLDFADSVKSLRERNYDFGESEERGMIILRRPNK